MYGNRRIGAFIDWCVGRQWEDYLALKLCDDIIKHCETEDILIVEGYMHYSIQHTVMHILEQKGVRVWIALRSGTFTKVSNGSNWRKK
jgi:hypothetical protein